MIVMVYVLLCKYTRYLLESVLFWHGGIDIVVQIITFAECSCSVPSEAVRTKAANIQAILHIHELRIREASEVFSVRSFTISLF